MPKIDTLLDRLGQVAVFSKLDLASRYHQIAMNEESNYRTTFMTHLGQWEFIVMLFRLCNALAIVRRLMNKVFATKINSFILVSLHEILIFSRLVEEPREHLTRVLTRPQKAKLYGMLCKCDFLKITMDYLGFELAQRGYTWFT